MHSRRTLFVAPYRDGSSSLLRIGSRAGWSQRLTCYVSTYCVDHSLWWGLHAGCIGRGISVSNGWRRTSHWWCQARKRNTCKHHLTLLSHLKWKPQTMMRVALLSHLECNQQTMGNKRWWSQAKIKHHNICQLRSSSQLAKICRRFFICSHLHHNNLVMWVHKVEERITDMVSNVTAVAAHSQGGTDHNIDKSKLVTEQVHCKNFERICSQSGRFSSLQWKSLSGNTWCKRRKFVLVNGS